MTTIPFPQTNLGTAVPFAALGTATSFDYAPQEGKPVALSVVANHDGTCQIFEVHDDGVAHSLGAAVAFTANDGAGAAAEMHIVDYPTKRLRMVYTNTDNNAGVATFRAVRE